MSTPQDPVVITREELLHALTASITSHRSLSAAAKIRIGLRWDPEPAVAEAEACADLLIGHVQTLREAAR